MANRVILMLAVVGSLLATGCARVVLDPNGGMETVSVPTLPYLDELELEYARQPEDGPLRVRRDAWFFLWGAVPLNHPNLALLREETLPPGTLPANESVTTRNRWYGHLFQILTLGVVQVWTVDYQFDPVYLKKIELPSVRESPTAPIPPSPVLPDPNDGEAINN